MKYSYLILTLTISSSSSLLQRRLMISFREKESRIFYVPEEQHSPLTNHPSSMASSSPPPSSSWSLEQDWALIDQLPKFTVGDDTNVRTFWDQLVACTPTLSDKTPKLLLERCQELDKASSSSESRSSETNRINGTEISKSNSSSRPLIFGPSPTLLMNWQIDLDNPNGKAVGQTKDGRTIWLRWHTIGRLEGDPFSDSTSSLSVFSLIPGGYLEAEGGRVYELGEPRLTGQQQQQPVPLSSSPISSVLSSSKLLSSISNDEKDKNSWPFLDWWLPATTATVSALLASTVLSACIGYGAGLSIISDGSSSSYHHQTATATTTTTAARRGGERVMTLSSSPPSITEQRERVEFRIRREQRLLESISDKIKKDQSVLLKLKQLENFQ